MIAFGIGDWIEKIEIGNIVALKHTIENILPNHIINNISHAKVPIFILIVIAIILYMKIFFFGRQRMTLICHTSFSPEVASIDTKAIKEKYYIKKQKIDLCDPVNRQALSKAITIQDEIIKKVNANHNCELGYYGIAHTPLAFRAGFHVGDQRKIHLFHRIRENEALFEEWSNEKKGSNDILEKPKELNKGSKSQELYVAIGTTFPIKEEEISSINKNKSHVLIFQSSTLGFDVLNNYGEANELKNHILKKVRDRAKKYNIRKLHLMISSSVAFTFLLGTSFSAQHDPEIIVYHYENGQYTWGINMSKNGEEAVINING